MPAPAGVTQSGEMDGGGGGGRARFRGELGQVKSSREAKPRNTMTGVKKSGIPPARSKSSRPPPRQLRRFNWGQVVVGVGEPLHIWHLLKKE